MSNDLKFISRKGFFRTIAIFVLFSFVSTMLIGPRSAFAQTMLETGLLTPNYQPTMVQGMITHPDNGLLFDFVINPGDDHLEGTALKAESQKLIKYFLAALTISEDDLWVNLSPGEENRIITEQLGRSEMGRDLLAEDYLLKQLAASLTDPKTDLGQKYWARLARAHHANSSSLNSSLSTLNRVWIIPEKAEVYEKNNGAFIVNSHLRVMMESDYRGQGKTDSAEEATFREMILPAIEKEVNAGKTFLKLRQMYHAMILATWYKKRLKESLLGQIYANKGLLAGVNLDDLTMKEKIYQQYIESFKQGVYNTIQEETDEVSGDVIPRKYFSGGFGFKGLGSILAFVAGMSTLSDQDVTVRWQGVEVPAGSANVVRIQESEQAEFQPMDLSDVRLSGALADPDRLGEIEVSSSSLIRTVIYSLILVNSAIMLLDIVSRIQIVAEHPYLTALTIGGIGLATHFLSDYSVRAQVRLLETQFGRQYAKRRLIAIGPRAVSPLITRLNQSVTLESGQYDLNTAATIKEIIGEIGDPAVDDLGQALLLFDHNNLLKQYIAEILEGIRSPKTFSLLTQLILDPDDVNGRLTIQSTSARAIRLMTSPQLVDMDEAFNRILSEIKPENITSELVLTFEKWGTVSQYAQLLIKALQVPPEKRRWGAVSIPEAVNRIESISNRELILTKLREALQKLSAPYRDQHGEIVEFSESEKINVSEFEKIVREMIAQAGRAQAEQIVVDILYQSGLNQTRLISDRAYYVFQKLDEEQYQARLQALIAYHEQKIASASAAIQEPKRVKILPGDLKDTTAFAAAIDGQRFYVKEKPLRIQNNSYDESFLDLELIVEASEDIVAMRDTRFNKGMSKNGYVVDPNGIWFIRAKAVKFENVEKPVLWITTVQAARIWWKIDEKFRKKYRTIRAEAIAKLSNTAQQLGFAAIIIPDETSALYMAGTLVGKFSPTVQKIFYKRPTGFDQVLIEQNLDTVKLNFEMSHYIKWLIPQSPETQPLISQDKPGQASSQVRPVDGPVRPVGGLVRPVGGPVRPVGGIDLNSLHLDLQIKRDAFGIPLPMTQQPLAQMKIEGITPIIIDIQPFNSAQFSASVPKSAAP